MGVERAVVGNVEGQEEVEETSGCKPWECVQILCVDLPERVILMANLSNFEFPGCVGQERMLPRCRGEAYPRCCENGGGASPCCTSVLENMVRGESDVCWVSHGVGVITVHSPFACVRRAS